MSARTCRWGILGTANIARKNWGSIWYAKNATLAAVGSRTPERAQQFIDECQAQRPFHAPPRAIGGYDALLAADDVDAVYIPLPTAVRKEWVIKAANAGKHVLVEKPCGCSADEVSEILAACSANNVQFMDGVMFMHSARLAAIREKLEDGKSVGKIKRIATQFSFAAEEEFIHENIRGSSKLEPLGCLGDLGWYNIRFILWVMNYEMPREVSGTLLSEAGGEDSPNTVPIEFSGEMQFESGVSATFYCAFVTENQQWANISGSRGHLHVHDFVLPYFGNELTFDVTNSTFEVTGCDFNMEARRRVFAVDEYSNSHVNAQEALMFAAFSRNVLERTIDPEWGQIALKTQQVLDACLKDAQS